MMRRERGRVIGRRRTEVGPEAEDARPHRNNEDRDRRQVSLQAAGRADATQGAHEEAQVEPADVDAQPFQDIRVPPQMRAARCCTHFGRRRWRLDFVTSCTSRCRCATYSKPQPWPSSRRLSKTRGRARVLRSRRVCRERTRVVTLVLGFHSRKTRI